MLLGFQAQGTEDVSVATQAMRDQGFEVSMGVSFFWLRGLDEGWAWIKEREGVGKQRVRINGEVMGKFVDEG